MPSYLHKTSQLLEGFATLKKQLLIFDLDDTLVDSENAYDRALRAIGISSQDSGYLQARATVKSRLGSGHVSARNRWLYMKEMLEQNRTFSPQLLVQKICKYEEVLLQDLKDQWNHLNRSLLFKSLKAQGHDLAILTNENTRLQILKVLQFDPDFQFFSTIVTSEETGWEKPETKIFQEIGKRFLNYSWSDMVMIGDSIHNDVLPALKLGMKAILTTEFRTDTSQSLDQLVVVQNLNEVPDILNRNS